MKRRKKILIIGKLPPPIGGVSIHVQRLISWLKIEKFDFEFIELTKNNIPKLLLNSVKYSVVHIHISNPAFRLLLVIYLRLVGVKSIVTFHGNIGRFNKLKNTFDILSIKLCVLPLLINLGSYKKAIKINPNSNLVTAFIRPVNEDELPSSVMNKIKEFRLEYGQVCCTNAYQLTFDKENTEIYGITQLIELYRKLDSALVVSDPSGAYSNYFRAKKISIPNNVFLISYPHSFWNVVSHSDIVIRSTTTDGDSLSVHEAIFLNKIVICSDCVDRPDGVVLYKNGDIDDLERKIRGNYSAWEHKNNSRNEDGHDQLLVLYNEIIYT